MVQPDNTLTLEWVKGSDSVALVFDRRTWKLLEDVAKAREQSAQHMITAAVAGCLGHVLEDNFMLNRIVRSGSES